MEPMADIYPSLSRPMRGEDSLREGWVPCSNYIAINSAIANTVSLKVEPDSRFNGETAGSNHIVHPPPSPSISPEHTSPMGDRCSSTPTPAAVVDEGLCVEHDDIDSSPLMDSVEDSKAPVAVANHPRVCLPQHHEYELQCRFVEVKGPRDRLSGEHMSLITHIDIYDIHSVLHQSHLLPFYCF
jgi:hypothetical protein